jgi:hypothetical protein
MPRRLSYPRRESSHVTQQTRWTAALSEEEGFKDETDNPDQDSLINRCCSDPNTLCNSAAQEERTLEIIAISVIACLTYLPFGIASSADTHSQPSMSSVTAPA